jgi:Tfp pilus assembly PilM family ATPase
MFTIGLFEKSIKFLEINKDNKISFAFNLTENINLDNLYLQNKLSENYLNDIAELINEVLNNSNTTFHTSKILIETNHCFANVIPLDFSETKDKINSNILWELSNYFPDGYKNCKVSYHKLLSESYSENIKETLIIAIKNNFIEGLKKLSKLINIKINSIDVEHFSSEKYFRIIRKNLLNEENILIIGCRKNRFDFSIINNSGCLAYDYFLLRDSNYQDILAKTYLKIDEKYHDLQINNIYLYGDELTSSSYNIINDISKKSRVILSNPFYEIGITDNIAQEIVSEGYKFIPLCGLALAQKQ